MKYIPGLKTLNAWKVKIGSEKFIVTPAHNIIHRLNNNWQLSHFVPPAHQSGWYVPTQFIQSKEYNLLYDLAWKPISKYSQTFESTHIPIKQIQDVRFYYYQPYDYNGNKVNSKSYSLGSTCTTIYQSPSKEACFAGPLRSLIKNPNIFNQGPDSEYFEAVNIGWRGLSGAAVTTTDTSSSMQFIGLFIRRIGNIGIEKSDSTLQTEMTGVSRGFIMPTKIIEKIIFSNRSNTKIY